MKDYPDRISAQTLAAALALGGGSSPSPTPGKVYQFAGSVPFLGLPALSADKVGNVYDVTDEFTSTTDFTDGGGKHYSAGTNVAIANTGTDESPVLKYDCLMGDLSEILDDINDLKTSSAEYPIASTTTGINPSITDSADGLIQDLTVYGRSRVSPNIYSGGNQVFESTSRVNVPLIKAGTYTVSAVVTSSDTSSTLSLFAIVKNNDTIAMASLERNTRASQSFELASDLENCSFIFYASNSYVSSVDKTASWIDIQIELGSTATPFEPYGIISIGDSGSLDVQTCGKNLFYNNDATNGYYLNQNGETISNIAWSYTDYLPIPTVDYLTLYFTSSATGLSPALCFYDKNKTFIVGEAYNSRNNITLAVPTNAKYCRVSYLADWLSFIMLVSGSTTTSYEPYISTTATLTTGLPYCGIPVTTGETYTDGDGVKWLADTASVDGVVKRCYKVTFDGSEDWDIQRYGEINCEFYINNLSPTAVQIPSSTVPNIVGNIQSYSANDLYSNDGVSGICITGNYVLLRLDTIKSASDLKTYLASNPVTVVYELAEFYEISLTASELSQLRGLKTYASTTNVTVTDSPTVDVGYLLNTGNGQAVSAVQQGLQGQISNIPAWLTDIPENHKNIYRGKYLGNSVSVDQLAAIADGSFDDLYVGDYWEIPVTIDNVEQSVKWRIADIDYFIGYRDAVETTKRMTAHHLVIVPDTSLYLSQPGSRTNGYNGSDIRTSGLDKAKTAINAVFPDMVLSHKNYISTAIDATGTVTRCEEQTCTIELMSQVMVFGFSRFQNLANLQEDINYSLGGQFALFRLSPKWKSNNAEEPIIPTSGATYLIQDPCYSVNREYWTAIWPTTYGAFNYSYNGGVRPYFLLGDASN